MKKNKRLQKIVDRALDSCFEGGKLNRDKTLGFVKAFEGLPTAQAISALSRLTKGLRRQLDRQTLVIESTDSLSMPQVRKIEKNMKNQFGVLKTEVKLNPGLLGGLKLKVGDTIFDYSLKNSIKQLKEGIVNG